MLAVYLSYFAAALGAIIGLHYWFTHKNSPRKILHLGGFLLLGFLGYAIALISTLFFSLVSIRLSDLLIWYGALNLLLFVIAYFKKLRRSMLYLSAFLQVFASLMFIDRFPRLAQAHFLSLELLVCALMISVCFYCAALAKNSLGFGFLLIGSAWLIFTGIYLHFLL